MVLDDLMKTAYSTKVNQLFTIGSLHRKISLVLITQNTFQQGPSSRDISLNSKLFMQGLKFVYFLSFIFEQRVASPDANVCRQLGASGG